MHDWWKEATVYQIYPRSFADSNNDGIGDINGIISKLDYLKNLGVDTIWLCPIYKSPDADNGYDISNYTEIDKKFGTLSDFERLIDGVHKRGMKLVMDAVFNHTSDEHKWFIESKKSKRNKYRNYYFWRKGKRGREPNNWGSHFGGPAWEYDDSTKEYYLHIWGRKQPDLNWENKEVRVEIYRIMRWWLDKGVDGFRFDVINFISKAPRLPDAPLKGKKYADGRKYYVNGPKVNAYLREMNREVFSKYNIMTVGELAAKPHDLKIVRGYVGFDRNELNMVFHENNEFGGVKLPKSSTLLEAEHSKLGWNLQELRDNFTVWQKGLEKDCWDSVYLGNHDYPRIVSRFGNDGEYRAQSAKMLATMVFTLRGTPYIYQGEEIGMTNPGFDSITDYRDIFAVNMYKEYLQKRGNDRKGAIKLLAEVSRENARTPMQWDDTANSGFTTGIPWIKVNKNYKKINVGEELNDKESVFYYYKKLIGLRKKHKALIYGKYDIIRQKNPDVYAYTREFEGEKFIVILNFASKSSSFEAPGGISLSNAQFLVGNYEKPQNNLKKVALRPYEAAVYRIQ